MPHRRHSYLRRYFQCAIRGGASQWQDQRYTTGTRRQRYKPEHDIQHTVTIDIGIINRDHAKSGGICIWNAVGTGRISNHPAAKNPIVETAGFGIFGQLLSIKFGKIQ